MEVIQLEVEKKPQHARSTVSPCERERKPPEIYRNNQKNQVPPRHRRHQDLGECVKKKILRREMMRCFRNVRLHLIRVDVHQKKRVSLKRQRERCGQSGDCQQRRAGLAGGEGPTAEGVCTRIGGPNRGGVITRAVGRASVFKY